jgi:exopolyphosphatase/guanosine-5'-triphosphate,3'-diphosphate pyrophosphatase
MTTHAEGPIERTHAVIDMGSNSFRLVVYRYAPGRWFRLVDEIREPVRLSEGTLEGVITPVALARASRAARLYAAYCDAAGIDTVDVVATSAVRDAANQGHVLDALTTGRLSVRVLTASQEAWYGYLGAVNGTTLENGWFMDLGGGSMQIGRVDDRHLTRSMSVPLGAVRLTERFLSGDQRNPKEITALRRHARDRLAEFPWIGGDGRLVGIGGALRTLAVMQQRAARGPMGDPIMMGDPNGYLMSRTALAATIAVLTHLPAPQRARLPGLRSDRADIILAAALTIDEVLRAVGTDVIEVCGQGLREGVFLEHYLAPADPPLLSDVRRSSVINAAESFGYDAEHARQIARVALLGFDATAAAGLHPGDSDERELLWAAGMLHDVGVLVDYSAHHRHSEYLVRNAGLPGFVHREIALIASMVRGHRKGIPTLDGYEGILRAGDQAMFARDVALLRLAEQLERAKAGQVADLRCVRTGAGVEFQLDCLGDPTLALWSAARETDNLQSAFGAPVRLTGTAVAP